MNSSEAISFKFTTCVYSFYNLKIGQLFYSSFCPNCDKIQCHCYQHFHALPSKTFWTVCWRFTLSIVLDMSDVSTFVLLQSIWLNIYEKILLFWHAFIMTYLTCNTSSIRLSNAKVRLSPSKNFFICLNDSPSKLMENAFYFILKALLVFKIFKLLSWLFGHRKNGLINNVTTWLINN